METTDRRHDSRSLATTAVTAAAFLVAGVGLTLVNGEQTLTAYLSRHTTALAGGAVLGGACTAARYGTARGRALAAWGDDANGWLAVLVAGVAVLGTLVVAGWLGVGVSAYEAALFGAIGGYVSVTGSFALGRWRRGDATDETTA